MSFLIIVAGPMDELQWEMLEQTSISLCIDSWWLLFTQPVLSEGKTAYTEVRASLDVVKKESRL